MAVKQKKKKLNSIGSTKKTVSKKNKAKKNESLAKFTPVRFLTSGITPDMNREQLDICTVKLNASARNQKLNLLAIYASHGWMAGGYDSFKDYTEDCLCITYDAALKQARAAEVAYLNFGIKSVGKFSDASMLALVDFNDKQIKKILNRIRKNCQHDPIEDFSLTASQVKNAIHDAFPSDGIDVTQHKEVIKDQERHEKLKKFETALDNQSEDIHVAEALITSFAETQSDKNIKAAINFLSTYLEEKES